MKAVVLLSGGLDSATAAAVAREEGYELYALTFLYGQRHAVEVAAARQVANALGIESHLSFELPQGKNIWGSSVLVGDGTVPKGIEAERLRKQIPPTYVPARNIIFLSIATAYAEAIGARDIFIGVNAVDYSGYPDCRPEFIDAFQQMIEVGTKAGLSERPIYIRTPLIHLSKAQIFGKATALGLDHTLTHSCYDPMQDGTACGECDSCNIRNTGFAEYNSKKGNGSK